MTLSLLLLILALIIVVVIMFIKGLFKVALILLGVFIMVLIATIGLGIVIL